MTFSEKIDEWLKEAEARPGSAVMILRLVANRLRELTERNEQLLAENIALQDGTKVQEYQKRITHLEYQLDLLKRRAGEAGLAPQLEAAANSLLVYNPFGRIFRLEPGAGSNPSLGKINGDLTVDGEFPRLLGVDAIEEVLLLFTSGRVTTLPVASLPFVGLGGSWSWEQAALPAEPHTGEQLACLLPLSALPVSAYFLQTSRRGCLKKTMTSVSQSVLGNQYLGKGTVQKSDRAFDAALCQKKERFALVTYEGSVVVVDVDDLSYASEERLRLGALDYVVAALPFPADRTLVCLTQNGKVVARPAGDFESSRSAAARGQALIPPSRLSQGTRFVGAVAASPKDRLAVLDSQGNLGVYITEELVGAGAVKTQGLILSVGLCAASA